MRVCVCVCLVQSAHSKTICGRPEPHHVLSVIIWTHDGWYESKRQRRKGEHKFYDNFIRILFSRKKVDATPAKKCMEKSEKPPFTILTWSSTSSNAFKLHNNRNIIFIIIIQNRHTEISSRQQQRSYRKYCWMKLSQQWI